MKLKLWIALILLTILLALGTVLVISYAQSGAEPDLIHGSVPRPGGAQSARQAYVALEKWSKTWAMDAEIIAVSASLLKSEGMGQWWHFQLYSPSTQRVAMVLVNTQKIWMLREQKLPYRQRVIVMQNWELDSDDFIAQWWTQGGSTLWPRADAQSLHVHLGQTKEGLLVWQLSLMNETGDLIDYLQVRADSGEVLNSGVAGGNE